MMDPIIREDLQRILESSSQGVFRNRRVLVSGGSGFLGSWICDALTELGASVACLDNLSTGEFENVQHLKGTKGFKFVKDDVCTCDIREEYDMILHMASRPAPEDYQRHPVETALANSEGTRQMLELAKRSHARVLFTSSSEVYGDPDVFPTPESYPGRVDPLGPRSCYEEGKRFGESLCKAYADQFGLDVRIARIFNSYGPRLRAEGFYGRVVSRFILQCLRGDDITVYGDGTQTRSFCYVTDTVSGLLGILQRDDLRGEAINIGSQEETKVLDVASKLQELVSSKARISFQPFPPGDHRRRQPHTGKAQRMIKWSPTLGLDEGLEKTVRWVKAQKALHENHARR